VGEGQKIMTLGYGARQQDRDSQVASDRNNYGMREVVESERIGSRTLSESPTCELAGAFK
jgi:hypothetical protein